MGSVETNGAEQISKYPWLPQRVRIKKVLRQAARGFTGPERWAYAQGWLGERTLPAFLGIGGVKAGTTWLHHNLVRHPDLWLPDRKEIHFFCCGLHRRIGSYADEFAPGAGRVVGEITPRYANMAPSRVKIVRRLLPDVRLILLLRNPIDRAWSHAVMKLGRERGLPIDQVPDAEIVEHLTGPVSRACGDYPTILDTWLSYFDAEQLLVGFYDDISAAPKDLFVRVLEHIGVSTDVDWSQFPLEQVIDRGVWGRPDEYLPTTGPRVPSRFRELLTEMYAPVIAEVAARYGSPADRWLDPA